MKKLLFDLSLLPLKVVNRIYDLHVGGSRRPVFMDIDEVFPSLRKIDEAYPQIRAELDAVLPGKDAMPRYHDLDAGQTGISATTEHDWKVFLLYAMGEKPTANRNACPRTCAVLDGIPNLFQAFFSILDGGKSVPAHCGPYRGYIRYHLGLKVPQVNPPKIRVHDEYHVWREGESVLFDDSWNHEVINEADAIRVVLIVDVLRPMPQPYAGINRGVTRVIQQFYAKGLSKKLR